MNRLLDYLLLVKRKENLFEVEELLQPIIENDDFVTGEETDLSTVIERLKTLGETEVLMKLTKKGEVENE